MALKVLKESKYCVLSNEGRMWAFGSMREITHCYDAFKAKISWRPGRDRLNGMSYGLPGAFVQGEEPYGED